MECMGLSTVLQPPQRSTLATQLDSKYATVKTIYSMGHSTGEERTKSQCHTLGLALVYPDILDFCKEWQVPG